jgi:predicted AAA+ superfamily ATPase
MRKRYGEGLYYYMHNIEVDFYVPEEDLAIQASVRLSDQSTIKREVDALVKLHKVHPLKKAVIVTRDEETTIKDGKLVIDVVPVWKWLLMPKNS